MAHPRELRCVLQHWYEFRKEGTRIGTENNKRLIDIRNLNMVSRRQGPDALRGEVLAAARSLRGLDPGHLVVGAGLYDTNLAVETLVRRSLHHQSLPHRIAATFGAAFFLRQSEDIACILAERSMTEKGELAQASSEALALSSRPCGRCSQLTLTRDWLPARVS